MEEARRELRRVTREEQICLEEIDEENTKIIQANALNKFEAKEMYEKRKEELEQNLGEILERKEQIAKKADELTQSMNKSQSAELNGVISFEHVDSNAISIEMNQEDIYFQSVADLEGALRRIQRKEKELHKLMEEEHSKVLAATVDQKDKVKEMYEKKLEEFKLEMEGYHKEKAHKQAELQELLKQGISIPTSSTTLRMFDDQDFVVLEN